MPKPPASPMTVPLNTVSGRVWIDANGDGRRGSKESGSGGVRVTLVGAGPDGIFGTADDTTATTRTAASGLYTFKDVAAGRYWVDFGGKSGYAFTREGVGGPQAANSDADAAGRSPAFDLNGGVRQTVDAGLVRDTRSASIGNKVWLDANGNGVQDEGETGLAGVKVQLRSAGADGVLGTADDALTRKTTDAQGHYRFDGLAAGNYRVIVTAKDGYEFTTANAGGNDAADSDVNADGQANVKVAVGEVNANVHAGLVATPLVESNSAAIGGRVWVDANGDGVQEAGETGLAGVRITLNGAGPDGHFGGASDTMLITTTNASGEYSFTGLAADHYYLGVTTPSGYESTRQDIGDDATDSDANDIGRTDTIVLGVGERVTSTDVGVVAYPGDSAIGNRVWHDANGNGRQDAGEAGMAGVAVTLHGAGLDYWMGTGDETTATTHTDADGLYRFSGLVAGLYQVNFTADADHLFTRPRAGSIGDPNPRAGDSDADSMGRSQLIWLRRSEIVDTVDAGLVAQPAVDPMTASIGDRVWSDFDGDGAQDLDEAGVAGMTVMLHGAGEDGVLGTSDDTTATTLTNANGVYRFDGLVASQYQVQFVGQGGDTFSPANAVGDEHDSDVDSNGKSQVITLRMGQYDDTVDAGVLGRDPNSARIGGRSWIDANDNGVQDIEESDQWAEVTLRGAGADGVFGTADDTAITRSTGVFGNFVFGGLAGGLYQLQFSVEGFYRFTSANVGDDATDSDVDSTGKTSVITLGVGENLTSVGAGVVPVTPDYRTSSISDRVWLDANANGMQDTGEAGLAGVAVTLLGSGIDAVLGTGDDTTATTMTNADGLYRFDGLAAGQYQVVFASQPGYGFAAQHAAGDYATDSDVDSAGWSHVITLGVGEANHHVDAGLVAEPPVGTNAAAIGDRVWHDTNGNGVQDPGEAGMAGVTVALRNAGVDTLLGTGDDTLVTTSTNADGIYRFDGLAPGTYRVEFTAGADYLFTAQNVQDYGGGSESDSDADGAGRSGVVWIYGDEIRTNVDAGLVTKPLVDPRTASIGDRVWGDFNGDGVQGSGEFGLVGVTVMLKGAGDDGVLGNGDDTTATTSTNTNGFYSFEGLAAGQYQVEFVAKAGDHFTRSNVGDHEDDDLIDSDADSTGKSHVVTLRMGQSDVSVDAGVIERDPKRASIAVHTWIDVNGNGLSESLEPSIARQLVTLKGAGADGVFGTGDDTTAGAQTGARGLAIFTGLAGGLYQFEVALNPLYKFTLANVGDDATDSDVDSAGKSHVFALGIGETLRSLGAGLVLLPVDDGNALIADRVWLDANANGMQDTGEAGIAGVGVTLYGAGIDAVLGTGDDTTSTTTTDADGLYRFDGLAAGQYQVAFDSQAGHVFTAQHAAGDYATDSDADSSGRSHVITLGPSELNTNVDAGLVQASAELPALRDLLSGNNALFDSVADAREQPAIADLADWREGTAASGAEALRVMVAAMQRADEVVAPG